MHAMLQHNFKVHPGAKWLQLLIQHIPEKSEHRARYYGAYGSRYRAKHHPSNTPLPPPGSPELEGKN